jgi:hypothetical protein
MRIPVLVRMPAAGSSTSLPAETTRGPGRRLLADSPRPGSTAAEQTPQTASSTDQGTSRCLWVIVTITVRPCLR